MGVDDTLNVIKQSGHDAAPSRKQTQYETREKTMITNITVTTDNHR